MDTSAIALGDIEMSRRLRNALTRANRYPGWENLRQYEALDDFLGVTYHQIWCRPGFGRKSLVELQTILRNHGWETQTKSWRELFIVPTPTSEAS